jgi:hypothetical protein
MNPCPICNAPRPAPARILPLAIQCHPLTGAPVLSLYRCHGALRIDRELLRFGIIAYAPWSCQNGRWYPWNDMTFDLRHRSLVAEEMRLALMGWI